jgi:hypothetical protein
MEIELAAGQVRVTGTVELEALRLVLEALSHKCIRCRWARVCGWPGG